MKEKTMIPKKKRGPPATGKGEPVVVRMHPPQLKAIDDWIADQSQPFPSRPEAVRRLVEFGLSVETRPRQPSPVRTHKAKAMAADQLDRLADKSASPEEQASRKHRLLHGPEEFRGVRVDRPKRK